jgi:elongation factor Ts
MTSSTDQIKELRRLTGAGILDCRKALEEAGGDIEKALLVLREKGLEKVAARASRDTNNGVLDLYSHGDGRVGVMVEINCETDFVARTPEFRSFAHELALQVAANSPRWIDEDSVPEQVLAGERERARHQAIEQGKKEDVIDRIVEGKLKKFLDDSCLMRQAYIRDDDKSVMDLVNEMIVSTGENVAVRRFERWTVGESLE